MKVEQLTCAIGAELTGVNLSDAVRDEALFAEIRQALLKHRVVFLRNQDISRADHVAFARKFGELEGQLWPLHADRRQQHKLAHP